MCDTNTRSNSEQMTTDDILEITAVYGTQISCIKKEEEPEIDLKFVFAEECGEILHDPLAYHDITLPIPLVYTTRLDQMNTLNQIERYTPKEAIEMIQKESKPRFEQMALKVKPEMLSGPYIDAYVNLCNQIKHLNTKVCIETHLRNQKLLKMCKPLRILLEDFKLNKKISLTKKMIDENNSTDEHVPSLYSSDDDEPVSKFMSVTSLSGRKNISKSTTIVAVKDKRSQEADIYIIDANNGIKCYWRTNMNECSILEKLHKSNQTILLEYCCWINRQKSISKLIQVNNFPKASMFFLNKPHNCLPRPCSCCCFSGTPMISKSKSILWNTESIDNYVTDPIFSNNIIDKAKKYMPNVPNSMYDQHTANDQPIDYLKWAVIIMKYHRIIFAQTQSFGENYEMGSNGELVNFTRPTVIRTIAEEKSVYERSLSSKISKLYFSYLICCWQNREDIIIRLRDVTKLLPSVIKFIRTPHTCRSDKCVCCCKPRPLINLRSIIPIRESTRKRKRTPVNKEKEKLKTVAKGKTPSQRKTPVAKKDKESLKINMDRNNSKIPIRDVSKKNINTERVKQPNISNSHNSTPKPNSYKTKNSINKQSTAQDNINLTLNSSSEHTRYAVPSNSQIVTKNIHLESTVMGTTDISSVDSLNTTTPNSIVNNILDRFNALKLTVNENGKLTAIISTAPDKLSTAEIKVISDILLLAGSQIEQLGISPQEFCARVNSSRKNNNYVQVPVPVPTKRNLVDTKMPESNMPPRTLQYITPKDPNGCKVLSLPPNSFMPITSNTSPVCSIYQLMSSLGGQNNRHLMHAYRLNCEEDQLEANMCQKIPQTQEIAEKLKMLDKPIKAMSSGSSAKRKPPQNPKPFSKKPRVKPPQEPIFKTLLQGSENVTKYTRDSSLINQNVIDKLNTPKPVIRTCKNQNQLSKRYKTALPIISNVSYTPAVGGHNPAPLQNPADTIGSGDAQTETPFISNGNIILERNPSGKDVTPPFTNIVDKQFPFSRITTNSNYIPRQNTSRTKVLPVGPLHDQIPLFVTNSNLPVVDTISTNLPQPINDISNKNLITEANIIGFEKVPVMKTNNEAPVGNSDLLPMQNIIDAVVSCAANKPKDNDLGVFANQEQHLMPVEPVSTSVPVNASVPSGNPLLHQMLTQAHASPSLQPIGLSSQYNNNNSVPGTRPNKKMSMKPSTQKHTSKGPFKKHVLNITPGNAPQLHPDDTDIEIKVESLIENTVINNFKPNNFTNEEILDAVNNKQLIDSDEEESIFGV